ncbi:MAG: histidinol-phosphate transaminase [Saprospiraceae bacterium]
MNSKKNKIQKKRIRDKFKSFIGSSARYKGGKAAPKGIKSYKLSSNENALGCSPKVKEAIANIQNSFHLYPDNTDKQLRDALCNYHDSELKSDQFVCANSGSEIIEMVIRSFTTPGDNVIVSNPCFLPYFSFSQMYGAEVIDIPLQGPNYSLNVNGIVQAITDRTRIIFLTSPNNPTGSYIPKSVLSELLALVSPDIIIIYDEVYYQYADATDFSTALPFVTNGHSIVAINSFSKAFGMASLRVGYCYTTLEIATYLRHFQRPFFINNLSMTAAIAALSDQSFIEKTVNHNMAERKFLENEFQRIGIDYVPTQGNFHLFHSPIPSSELVNALYEQGVMIRDVASFGAPGKVRATIGRREGNQKLISELEKISF